MSCYANEEFVRFLWLRRLYTSLEDPSVSVLSPGTANPADGVDVLDARISIGGALFCGPVAVHVNASDWHKHLHHIDFSYDSCILHIVLNRDAVVCRADGSVIPTLVIEYPAELDEKYGNLLSGSVTYRCGERLAAMPAVKRNGLLTSLAIERLERKYNDFVQLYREAGNDWNEAFYITLFKTMGSGTNREPYMQLARTVSFTHICKIRESVMSVEALLLGGAGLLDVEYADSYTHTLRCEYDHLQRRFNIVPMHRNQWDRKKHNPHNHPVVRIVELAALLASNDFMFSRLLACRTPCDAHQVLSAEASEYWNTHYLPGSRSRYGVKGFGATMLDNLCVNLVAPMMFTYGKVFSEESLKERAVEMLEMTGPETHIGIVKGWMSTGVRVDNAFFTQALIQLSRDYCEKKQCTSCNIGKNVLCSQ